MARAIDKDKLITSLAWHDQQGMISNIYDVLDIIEAFPTLTQPNEPLTCDGCIALGTSYGPCMNCIRSRLRGDLYRRPPEEVLRDGKDD